MDYNAYIKVDDDEIIAMKITQLVEQMKTEVLPWTK